MPAETWPSGLPNRLLQSGFSKGLGDGRIRSDMDVGPAKVRRRSTAASKPLSGALWMTSAQIAAAETFVETNLANGSLPFYFPHPLTQAAMLVRFVDLPSYTAVGWNTYAWAMSLEILP